MDRPSLDGSQCVSEYSRDTCFEEASVLPLEPLTDCHLQFALTAVKGKRET